MKLTLFTLLFSVLLFSCQKTYEDVVEEAVIEAITTGNWKVTVFEKAGTDVTSSFADYKFIFQTNRTVDAIKGQSLEATGAWEENPQAKTIYAQFTSGGPVLQLLNGTWTVTKNSWTYVEATQTVNGEVRKLRLDKE